MFRNMWRNIFLSLGDIQKTELNTLAPNFGKSILVSSFARKSDCAHP